MRLRNGTGGRIERERREREREERKEMQKNLEHVSTFRAFEPVVNEKKRGRLAISIIVRAKAMAADTPYSTTAVVNKRTEAGKIAQDAVYDRQGACTANGEISDGRQIGSEG